MTDSTNTVRPQSHLEGIGGWLILLAIGQVLGPLQVAIAAIQEYWNLPEGVIGNQPLAFAGDLTLRGGYLILLIYTAFLFFNRRAEFPRMFILSVVATLILPLAVGVWVTMTSGVNTMANLTSSGFLKPYAIAVALCAVWVVYVIKSVRVRNTFVR